jgi:hypothetical protein
MPVTWDAEKSQPTCSTNHVLLPGDRVFVQLSTEPSHPVPPTPAVQAAPPAALPPVSFHAPAPTAVPQPTSPIVPYPPCPSATLYAAFPTAVPSPFAPQPSPSSISPSVIATQAYFSTTPLKQPAAAESDVSEEPQCSAAPCTCQTAACAGTSALNAAPDNGIAQVMFNIEVIEDHSASLKEFVSLRGSMPILTADSDIMLATLRVLKKQRLIRTVSSPNIVTIAGRPAVLQIGCETPADGEAEVSFHGRRFEVLARELGGGLAVKFQCQDTTGCDAVELETSLVLPHGQTIVMQANGQHAGESDDGEQDTAGQPSVYLVLTPKLVR